MTARPNIVPSDTLLALAEQCEQATGPDRELDAEVEVALQKWPEGWTQGSFNESATITWTAFQDSRGEQRVRLNANGIGYASWAAPRYTASLDAAMTLVGDGCFECGNLEGAWARVIDGSKNGFFAEAATPALALCAAALRSLSTPSMKDVDDDD